MLRFQAEEFDFIKIIKIEESIHVSNASIIKNGIIKITGVKLNSLNTCYSNLFEFKKNEKTFKQNVNYLIFDCSSVEFIDNTGVKTICEVFKFL